MSTIAGISLVAFANRAEVDTFMKEAEVEGLPPPVFELSYKLKATELPPLRHLSGRVVSSHAPLPLDRDLSQPRQPRRRGSL